MSFSSAIFAISINSSGSIKEPVGLLGELIIINLVFEVILDRKSSGLSLNALRSYRGTVTILAPKKLAADI